MKITGNMINYYFVCKRKLWYFTHDITMEHNSEAVAIGKLIDETSYSRQRKSILIDESINIDFIKDWNIIHEIKKSKAIEEASIWQVKYYIYVLRNHGVEIKKGILDYPQIRKRQDVYLEEEDIARIKEIIDEIETIKKGKLPKEKKSLKLCKKCSYYELCYV